MDAHAAGPGMPTLADPRMSVLTLTGQGMLTLLGSNTACSNYLFNFLFMVLIISPDLLYIILFLICSYNEIDYLVSSTGSAHPIVTSLEIICRLKKKERPGYCDV